jgi:hypothetical protein
MENNNQQVLDTHHKALSINLEAATFGSFAEIGAGQEVARWFLQVGGGSATVAKSISAYDKEVSDDIYGATSRYVSEQRLQAMLDKEWEQLLSQLQKTRGDKTRFFSFVDTISARNYAGTNLAHGWIGIRFQAEPEGPANDVILHVNLMDPTNVQQQEAVGILGVNLVHAVFHARTTADGFIKDIAEGVAPSRLEIDYVTLAGPAFGDCSSGQWSCRSLHACLVAHNFAQAVIFTNKDDFQPFIDALYKKAVVIAPGIFQHPEKYHAHMMEAGVQKLKSEQHSDISVLGLFGVTVPPLLDHDAHNGFADLLQKIDALHSLGYGVLLMHERELYKMSALIQRFTSLPIRFVIGISVMLRVFEDDYRHLGGNTLRAVSMLFFQNVRIFAFPMATSDVEDWSNKLSATGWHWTDASGYVFADSLKPPGPLRYLYEYLLASNFIVPVEAAEMPAMPPKAAAQ